jgi:predicted metal-dependent phosphoesterase TrpH
MIIADLHVHSYYSEDSLLKPHTIIKVAASRGINCLAITDHNTIKGGLELVKEAKGLRGFIAIPGIEVQTDVGDVMLLFVDEEVKARKFDELLDYAKSVDAMTVLAHPYRKHVMVEEVAKKVRVIEVLNARSSRSANSKARSLALMLSKTMCAGSDAHMAFEVGRAVTIMNGSSEEDVRESLSKGGTRVLGSESSPVVHLFSFACKAMKGFAENLRFQLPP